MNARPTAGRMAGDEGFTLIEVMVALLVFAIISTGIVAGTTTIIQMTGDNRARITAANLASQELDTVRAISDLNTIQSKPPQTITVGDPSDPGGYRTYSLTRTVAWSTSSGTAVTCNSSSDLFFLRVNVRVTWAGMLGTTAAVQDDTILAPNAGSTNSSTGSIEIKVHGVTGQAIAGVSVSVRVHPGSSGATPGSPPQPTTVDGCTYANDLQPGTYDVTISRAGFRDDQQQPTPSEAVVVTAGTTQTQAFTYDQAASFTTEYTPGPVAYSGAASTPSNLTTSFMNTGNTSTTTAPASSVSLFPYSSGYSVVTGPTTSGTTTCASSDPAAWPAGVVNGVLLASGSRAAGAAASGGSSRMDIPMGVVLVRATSLARLTAVRALAVGTGNPGCSVTGTTLTWTATGNAGWVPLLLPYGSWSIKANGVTVTAANLQVVTNAALPGVSPDGTVTLDPRPLP